MSTVIAYIDKFSNVGYLASDSNGIDNDNCMEFNNKKIFQYQGNKHNELKKEGYNILIGMVGSYKELEKLRYYDNLFDDFVSNNISSQNNHINRKFIVKNIVPKLQNLFTNANKCESDIIIIARNKIYIVQNDYSVLEPKDNFYAIGTGQYYALGSLYTINKLREISNNILFSVSCNLLLETAIKSSFYYPGIGGKIDILSTEL